MAWCGIPSQQLDSCSPYGPNIGLEAVAFALDDLCGGYRDSVGWTKGDTNSDIATSRDTLPLPP